MTPGGKTLLLIMLAEVVWLDLKHFMKTVQNSKAIPGRLEGFWTARSVSGKEKYMISSKFSNSKNVFFL